VREILDTVECWTADGVRTALATLVRTERSSPRQPGAAMAVSEHGDVAGSLTGGCVEPAIYE
jgi:xanthine dehydrogenase accessory factor